jgi:hypothetical protein
MKSVVDCRVTRITAGVYFFRVAAQAGGRGVRLVAMNAPRLRRLVIRPTYFLRPALAFVIAGDRFNPVRPPSMIRAVDVIALRVQPPGIINRDDLITERGQFYRVVRVSRWPRSNDADDFFFTALFSGGGITLVS